LLFHCYSIVPKNRGFRRKPLKLLGLAARHRGAICKNSLLIPLLSELRSDFNAMARAGR
jgi:hypothetical protein